MMKNLEFRRSIASQCTCFRKRRIKVIVHGDDFLSVGFVALGDEADHGRALHVQAHDRSDETG